MGERTEGSISIDASPKEILAVIADFESYPDWVDGIHAVEIRVRDADGVPTEVAFEFSTMGLSASYTLAYAYAASEGGVSWSTVEASGAVKDVQGEYVLEPDGEGTEVTYRLEIELSMPVPGILRRQGEKRAVKTALDGLKRRVEEA